MDGIRKLKCIEINGCSNYCEKARANIVEEKMELLSQRTQTNYETEKAEVSKHMIIGRLLSVTAATWNLTKEANLAKTSEWNCGRTHTARPSAGYLRMTT